MDLGPAKRDSITAISEDLVVIQHNLSYATLNLLLNLNELAIRAAWAGPGVRPSAPRPTIGIDTAAYNFQENIDLRLECCYAFKMSKPEDLLGFAVNEPQLEVTNEFETQETKPEPSGELVAKYRTADIDSMTDPKKLARWMVITRNVPLESIDQAIVERTYAAAVWLFRSSAISGDLKATRAMESWLEWAKPIISKPKKVREVKPSRGSVAFLPRVPRSDNSEEE